MCLHTWPPDGSAAGNITGLSGGKASVGKISHWVLLKAYSLVSLTVLSLLPGCKHDRISQLPAPVPCFPHLLPCPSHHNGPGL